MTENITGREDFRNTRRRFDRIGELIRTGNVNDLTQDAREWYVRRANGLESFAVSRVAEAEDLLDGFRQMP